MNRNITSTMTIDKTKKSIARPMGAKQGVTGSAIIHTVNLGQGFQNPAPIVQQPAPANTRRIVTAADYTPADRQPESQMLYETAARQRPFTPLEKLAQQEALKHYRRPF
ncbi:hypothetical protein ABKE32_002873 [Escherichia albertii]|nr:hypothetical protein [Escherichia albertii]